jgi:hypothetical protein
MKPTHQNDYADIAEPARSELLRLQARHKALCAALPLDIHQIADHLDQLDAGQLDTISLVLAELGKVTDQAAAILARQRQQ